MSSLGRGSSDRTVRGKRANCLLKFSIGRMLFDIEAKSCSERADEVRECERIALARSMVLVGTADQCKEWRSFVLSCWWFVEAEGGATAKANPTHTLVLLSLLQTGT